MLFLALLACDGDDPLTRDDLASVPDCRSVDTADWLAALDPSATWEAEDSLLVVALEVWVDAIKVDDLELAEELASSTAQVDRLVVDTGGLRLTAQIQPDAGVDTVDLAGALRCGSEGEPYALALDISGTPSIGGEIPVRVE